MIFAAAVSRFLMSLAHQKQTVLDMTEPLCVVIGELGTRGKIQLTELYLGFLFNIAKRRQRMETAVIAEMLLRGKQGVNEDIVISAVPS